jgi:hypothetical protein
VLYCVIEKKLNSFFLDSLAIIVSYSTCFFVVVSVDVLCAVARSCCMQSLDLIVSTK